MAQQYFMQVPNKQQRTTVVIFNNTQIHMNMHEKPMHLRGSICIIFG